jgi:hypothetical protein
MPERSCSSCGLSLPDGVTKCPSCGVEADSGTKTCPFCAETIKAAAVKCKHCKSDITETLGAIAGITKRRLRVGVLLIWLVLFLVIGYAAGGISSQVVRRLSLANASIEEQVIYWTCIEDPNCDVPLYNGFGYVVFFAVLIGGVFITRPTWNPKKEVGGRHDRER